MVLSLGLGLGLAAEASAGKSPEQKLQTTFKKFSGQLIKQNRAIAKVTNAHAVSVGSSVDDLFALVAVARLMEQTAARARASLTLKPPGLSKEGDTARRQAIIMFKLAGKYAKQWKAVAQAVSGARSASRNDQ